MLPNISTTGGTAPQKSTPAAWQKAAVLLALLCPLATAISRLVYPFDTGHLESGLWKPAELIIAGVNPYDLARGTNPPFVMSPYGPLYYLSLGVGLKTFGAQFWFGRLLSLLAMGVCVFCIVRLVIILTTRRELAWLGAGLFLSQLPIAFWSAMQRPDWLALAFSLTGLWLCFEHSEKSRNFKIVLAGLCFAAGVLCRQTAFLPLVIALIFLRRESNARDTSRRGVLWLAGVFVLLVASATFILNATSRGGFVQQQWILPSATPRNLDNAIGYALAQFVAPSAAFVLAIVMLSGLRFLQNRKIEKPADRESPDLDAFFLTLLSAYLIAASLLAFVTSSREGANLNYWLEAGAVASILTPLCLQRWEFSSRVIASGFIVIALSACVVSGFLWCEEQTRWRDVPKVRVLVAALQQSTPQGAPVFSRFPDLAVAAGREYWFNDFYQYEKHVPNLHRVLNRALEEKQVAAVIAEGKISQGYRAVAVNGQKQPLVVMRSSLWLAVPDRATKAAPEPAP